MKSTTVTKTKPSKVETAPDNSPPLGTVIQSSTMSGLNDPYETFISEKSRHNHSTSLDSIENTGYFPPSSGSSLEENKIENGLQKLELSTMDSNRQGRRDKEGINIIPSKKKLSNSAVTKPYPGFSKLMGYELQSREEVLLFKDFAEHLKIKHNLNPYKFNLRLKLLKDYHYIVIFKKNEFYAQLIKGHNELNKFYNTVRMRTSLMDGLLNTGHLDKFFTEYLPKAKTFYALADKDEETVNINGYIISKATFECMVEDSYSNFIENIIYEDKLSI